MSRQSQPVKPKREPVVYELFDTLEATPKNRKSAMTTRKKTFVFYNVHANARTKRDTQDTKTLLKP